MNKPVTIRFAKAVTEKILVELKTSVTYTDVFSCKKKTGCHSRLLLSLKIEKCGR